ncbi:MAG: Putative methanogenesis marker 13 metalloprotein [Methanomicrobiales archaeon 53_19]|jgi:putative methanogenesis marker 13 metalloprotein|uniref:Ni-sirohydrochlorin a,c-diamide reductive cyclase catalytic subunit n=1 Tax=Methanocalculus sp. TaxID=2004547 RepID=UPI000748BCFF|nr:Ni-sirohydrochlorin a,c-diamide reductive cyclase catalytic subunit [Methanocalculus sp.]KUL03615.1 MAG: Putative methanogenesis marker 13 metalloprotein [Methanomicrobiales archaeon 53_19]HIJ06248.1 Ni-sirohydrochlorin a,c-diamide reductive cyclase catalytic subunit [Methanocalculus sp.]
MQYIQPRPSSIVAALYTARDLGVDVAILHGPSGCSFKHARLLEEDGLRVITTSLADNEFIFGGQQLLEDVLRYAEKTFSPGRIAVIGTCVSMIIGEDMQAAIDSSGITTPAIAIDIHAGFSENIDGVIAALEPAAREGWISEEELTRQRHLLAQANEVERLRGAASKRYIEPERGDLKHIAAAALLDCARSGKKGMAIMNAKKETAYMFMDELCALHEAAPDADIIYYANLDDRGLPKVRGDAERIRTEAEERGLPLSIIGSLDEYGALGDELGRAIRERDPEYLFIVGVPHAVPAEYTEGITVFSITNGPRQVAPLRELGHRHVLVEIDLHPKTLGVRSIVESEFGAVLRSMKCAPS